jgi:hypothetical protein
MTLDGEVIPKESKATKASRADEQRETFQCGCKKGGTCHREQHTEGTACEQTVTLSKSNRHKVCNQCRKNKNKKGGDGTHIPRAEHSRIVPVTVIPNVPVIENSFLAVPLPHSDMPSAIPSMHSLDMGLSTHASSLLNQGSSSLSHADRSSATQALNGKMQCACDKGGSCSRTKHNADQQCDRTVTITKNDKHTRCKGCRYLKKRRVNGAIVEGSGRSSSVSMSIEVPLPAAQPQLLSMSSGAVPLSHALPMSHHDLNHL